MAPKLISHQQSAFVPGRKISECITLVSENMHLLNKQIFGGNAAIRLDIAKAFDTLTGIFCSLCSINLDSITLLLIGSGFSLTQLIYLSLLMALPKDISHAVEVLDKVTLYLPFFSFLYCRGGS